MKRLVKELQDLGPQQEYVIREDECNKEKLLKWFDENCCDYRDFGEYITVDLGIDELEALREYNYYTRIIHGIIY